MGKERGKEENRRVGKEREGGGEERERRGEGRERGERERRRQKKKEFTEASINRGSGRLK